jgi:hypothetical protein
LAESLAIGGPGRLPAGGLATLGLAAVAAAHGRAERAARLAAATATAATSDAFRHVRAVHAALAERWLESARRSLTAGALAAAEAEGRAMSLEQAVAYALEEGTEA